MKPTPAHTEGSVEALVNARTGIVGARRLPEDRARLIERAMARTGTRSEAALVALLRRDQRAFDDLVSDLTVPESYFFRDPPHFALLRGEVLPALTAARTPQHVYAVWSAGCAGGEEAYSLAILLEQEGLAGQSRVLGTDVSTRALLRAREGLYAPWALRATSEADIERYFTREGRSLRLVPRIRERVRFAKHSLSKLPYPRPDTAAMGFDLVLCRNVFIYLDATTIAFAAQQLAQSLAESGFLMLGPSDPLLRIEEWCEAVTTPLGILYQRRPAEPARRASRPTATSHLPRRKTASAARRSTLPPPPAKPSSTKAGPSASEQERAALEELSGLRSLAGEAAEAACRDELTRNPLSAELQLLHAELLLDLGRVDDAEHAVRRALYLDPSVIAAQMLAATLAEGRGEAARAIRGYARVAATCADAPPDDPVPHAEGLTHAALGELARRRVDALASDAAGGEGRA